MIKFLKDISIFSFLASLFYVALVVAWGELMPPLLRPNLSDRTILDDNILLTLNDLKDAEDIDVLFLGSSHTYRTFDPRIWKRYGYNTFNLGSSAQTHIHTGLLLNQYLEQLNPKLIVYEVYPDIFGNDGVEANSVFLSYDICLDQMTEVVFESQSVKSMNEMIFARYRNIFLLNDTYEINLDISKQEYKGNGFVERKSNVFSQVEPFLRTDILQSQIDAFQNNIRKLENANIPFVLVRAPVTQIEVNQFPDMNAYNVLMQDYSEFIDLSQVNELQDSIHFYDFHHLNQKGVEIFNPIFIDTLLQLNLLKDTYK